MFYKQINKGNDEMTETIEAQRLAVQDMPMTKQSWKEQIRAAASRAADEKQISRISKATEIKADRLHQFVSKGYLGSDDVKLVADWLATHGYLDPVSHEKPPPKPPYELIAAEMYALADLLASPEVDKEIKGERFVATVRGWHSGIDKYAAMLKK